MLMPKRVKHRKVQRGRIRGNATRGNRVSFGEFGIMALESGRITARQIEAARIACNRALAGAGKIFIRIFPHKPYSSKPAETRQGKGKGEVDYWAAIVRPGTVMYEVRGAPEDIARKALARIAHKLPVRAKFVAAVEDLKL